MRNRHVPGHIRHCYETVQTLLSKEAIVDIANVPCVIAMNSNEDKHTWLVEDCVGVMGRRVARPGKGMGRQEAQKSLSSPYIIAVTPELIPSDTMGKFPYKKDIDRTELT